MNNCKQAIRKSSRGNFRLPTHLCTYVHCLIGNTWKLEWYTSSVFIRAKLCCLAGNLDTIEIWPTLQVVYVPRNKDCMPIGPLCAPWAFVLLQPGCNPRAYPSRGECRKQTPVSTDGCSTSGRTAGRRPWCRLATRRALSPINDQIKATSKQGLITPRNN